MSKQKQDPELKAIDDGILSSSIESKSIKSQDPRKDPNEVRRQRKQLQAGPLAIPHELLRPGFKYYICHESDVHKYQRLGYDVVRRGNGEIGEDNISKEHQLGSVASRNLGKDKDGRPQPGVLMEISDELWEINQEVEREKVRDIENTIGKPPPGMDESFYHKN